MYENFTINKTINSSITFKLTTHNFVVVSTLQSVKNITNIMKKLRTTSGESKFLDNLKLTILNKSNTTIYCLIYSKIFIQKLFYWNIIFINLLCF